MEKKWGDVYRAALRRGEDHGAAAMLADNWERKHNKKGGNVVISDGYRANFTTLIDAIKNGDSCLMECSDKNTGEAVMVVCAVNRNADGSNDIVPLAKMFDGDPYDEVDPPQ